MTIKIANGQRIIAQTNTIELSFVAMYHKITVYVPIGNWNVRLDTKVKSRIGHCGR